MILWTIVVALVVTWGNRLDWPDNVHVDYGFPLVWSTNTLSTIVGPVDLWTVDIAALTMNLVLWSGIMVAATTILLYIFNNKQ